METVVSNTLCLDVFQGLCYMDDTLLSGRYLYTYYFHLTNQHFSLIYDIYQPN